MSLLAEKLKDRFGVILPANANEYRICCPECTNRQGSEDTKFHCYVNIAKQFKDKIGAWNCFRCGYAGYGLENLGLTIDRVNKPIEELFNFAEESTIEPNILTQLSNVKSAFSKESKIRPVLPPEYSTNFSENLGGIAAWKYLTQDRGVSPEKIYKYKIGYCAKGKYANYVILPCYEYNTLTYFVARSIYKKIYKNAPYENKDVIFNLNGQKNLIIVEGIFDAINVGKEAIALLGKNIKLNQIKKILEVNPKNIFIFLDNDAKNLALEYINFFKAYTNVRLVKPVAGKDPGNMTKKEIINALRHSYTLNPKDVLNYLSA